MTTLRTLFSLALLVAFSSACSDKVDDLPPGPEPICENDEANPDKCDTCVCPGGYIPEDRTAGPGEETSNCLLISSTDWMTSGSLSILDLDTNELLTDVTTYFQDSVLRVIDDEVYVLQRHLGDSVIKLDDRDTYSIAWEESVRTDEIPIPNPHDMVRVGDYFYITYYNDGRIVQANADPMCTCDFLTGVEYRIPPPEWDGAFSEISQMKVVDGILYVGSEGLDDSWRCGSRSDGSPNRSRIYALYPDTLTPAPVFENGQTWKELSFCNMRDWIDLPDGRTLVYSLGNYRQYGELENDGGIEIIDLHNPTAPPEVQAVEGDFGTYDIFGVFLHDDTFYVSLVGELAIPIYLYKLDTSTPGAWALDGDPLYEGNLWGAVGWGDELFVVERNGGFEGVIRIDTETGEKSADPILTPIAPETLTLFQRVGGCW